MAALLFQAHHQTPYSGNVKCFQVWYAPEEAERLPGSWYAGKSILPLFTAWYAYHKQPFPEQ
jgi:hypothetical protein